MSNAHANAGPDTSQKADKVTAARNNTVDLQFSMSGV
jgi:hypothetical protein